MVLERNLTGPASSCGPQLVIVRVLRFGPRARPHEPCLLLWSSTCHCTCVKIWSPERGGHFAPWWPALRPAAVPEDCQATGIRSNACADWVGWDWCRRDGGMRERTRNAHHGLPSARITKSQRTHLTKPSDITKRASRVAGYALVSSSLI